MFKFDELKNVHLEITSRCQASCPMCPRKYHGGVENENLVLADWTYEDFVKIFDSKVLNQLKMIYFCGNFGDPILNDDLPKMCLYIKNNAPHIDLRIHTNGGARPWNWWRELYWCMPEKHVILFGIDGLEDTNHIYRIGVPYDNVIKNARIFIDSGGIAEWVFIKFKHNEHQEEEAERRSKEYGFKRFTVKHTTRFAHNLKYDVLDKEGKVIYQLEPPTENKVVFIDRNKIKTIQEDLQKAVIDCYVLKEREIYIDAHKHVFPCCFTASTPYHYRAKNTPADDLQVHIHGFYDKLLEQYYKLVDSLGGIDKLDAMNHHIEDIINNDKWQSVWDQHWNGPDKLLACARVCGKTDFSTPKDQFVKRKLN